MHGIVLVSKYSQRVSMGIGKNLSQLLMVLIKRMKCPSFPASAYCLMTHSTAQCTLLQQLTSLEILMQGCFAGLRISKDGQDLIDSKTGQIVNAFGATRFDVAVHALRGDFDPPKHAEVL